MTKYKYFASWIAVGPSAKFLYIPLMMASVWKSHYSELEIKSSWLPGALWPGLSGQRVVGLCRKMTSQCGDICVLMATGGSWVVPESLLSFILFFLFFSLWVHFPFSEVKIVSSQGKSWPQQNQEAISTAVPQLLCVFSAGQTNSLQKKSTEFGSPQVVHCQQDLWAVIHRSPTLGI